MSDIAKKFGMACGSGELQMVKNLLASGKVNVNTLDSFGRPGIVVAAQNRQFDMLQFLLENGADVTLTDRSGRSALHHAAVRAHDQMTSLLLRYKTPVDIKDNEGQTALMLAAAEGYVPTATHLLKAGCNPETGDKYGDTAIFKAARNFRPPMIKLLLEYRANMGHLNLKGEGIYAKVSRPASPSDEHLRHICLQIIDPEMERRDYMKALVDEMRNENILCAAFEKSVLTEQAEMLQAAASDQFPAYLDQKTRQGKYPNLDILTRPNNRGVSVVDMLFFKKKEHYLLRADIWENQVDQLEKFYTTILSPWQQKKYQQDLQSLYQQIKVGHLSRKAPKPVLKKRRA